jgi:hypothetical protein
MILICVGVSGETFFHGIIGSYYRTRFGVLQTDVLPALSMYLEPPESGLLSRSPRNVRKGRTLALLLQAYGFLGIIESLCAMSMCVPTCVARIKPFLNVNACAGRS